jgi:hypothetical protein
MNTELIPEQNYNSNRKSFRNYIGRKRKKKQMKERPKEKGMVLKEIKRNHIRVRNKGWRYKDALKRKRFKSKQEKKIMKIYQKRIKYNEEKNTPIIAAVKERIRTIIERKGNGKQEKGVRAWSNPHKQLALAMLRNFILLLKHKIPEGEGSQRKYYKELENQKEIICKEIEKERDKLDLWMAGKIIWKTMENILKEIIREDISKTSINIRNWLEWTKGMEQLISSLICKTMIKISKEMNGKDQKEAAAVTGIKNPGKTVVATVGKPLKKTINQTGKMIKTERGR